MADGSLCPSLTRPLGGAPSATAQTHWFCARWDHGPGWGRLRPGCVLVQAVTLATQQQFHRVMEVGCLAIPKVTGCQGDLLCPAHLQTEAGPSAGMNAGRHGPAQPLPRHPANPTSPLRAHLALQGWVGGARKVWWPPGASNSQGLGTGVLAVALR